MFNVKAHPVNLLDFNNDGEMQFNTDIVNDLFINPELNDRNVVVFSIVGAFRQGKSFLMNYVLRYLYSNYTSLLSSKLINPHNWLGDKNEPLTGFTWISGSKRNTTGLVFWSDVFLHEQPNGEKIAIYIMDTQGLFDNLTTTNENCRIFSLCTLLSSVQVFNVINTIQENQLQFLSFASSFAEYASKSNTDSKPFQNLFILIRDWCNKDENSFGLSGGNEFLKDFLMIEENQHPDLKKLRKNLPSVFESINCFLMPHPGKTVAQNSKYDGSWSDIRPDFVNSMKELFTSLLSPNNLKTKIINGNVINSTEFLIYIKLYVEQFQSGEIPKAESIYDLTLQKQLQILIPKCVDVYTNFFKKKEIGLCDENKIHKLHNAAESAALSFLASRKKFGSSSEHADLENKVKNKIGTVFEHWKAVSLAEIKKLSKEIEKTNEQLRQRDLAQNESDSAKTKLNDAVREDELLKYELKKSEEAIEAAQTTIKTMKLKLFAQEEAHKIAIANAKRKAEIEQTERDTKAAEREKNFLEQEEAHRIAMANARRQAEIDQTEKDMKAAERERKKLEQEEAHRIAIAKGIREAEVQQMERDMKAAEREKFFWEQEEAHRIAMANWRRQAELQQMERDMKAAERENKLFEQEEAHRIAIAKGKREAELQQMERDIEDANREKKQFEENMKVRKYKQEMLEFEADQAERETEKKRHMYEEKFLRYEQEQKEAELNKIRLNECRKVANRIVKHEIQVQQEEKGIISEIKSFGKMVWNGFKRWF